MSYIPRNVTAWAEELLSNTPSLIIEGARQVGKSTLAIHLSEGQEPTFLSFDDAAVRAAAELDPDGFIADAGPGLVILDEIQRMPHLTLAVKASIDRDRRPGRFILTGSSSLLRVRGLADSLAGRSAYVPLYGFSQGEMNGQIDDFVSVVLQEPQWSRTTSSLSRADYAALISAGSFPEFHALSPRLRNARLDDYVRSLVERDMPELRREVRPDRMLALIRTLAGRQAAELIKARIAHETDIPATTITGYLDLLRDVGLLTTIPPWTSNLSKRETGRPKAFLNDSALALRLARVTTDQLARIEYGEALGAFLEAFVYAELLKQRTWSEQEFELFHYRQLDGTEVDVIIELSDGRIIAVEVKTSSSFSASQFKGLVKLRERVGDRLVAGFVLNTGTSGYRYAENLYGAPISRLWASGADD